MTDRSEALVVTADGTRHVYEPRSDGRYLYVEKRRTADGWRTVGSEVVEHLTVENRDLHAL